MVNCDNFLHFMVEEDEDLDDETVKSREEHARACEECSRLQRGYRAFVSCRRVSSSIGKDAPWVKENLVKAANQAIDRMLVTEKWTRFRPRTLAAVMAVAVTGIMVARVFPGGGARVNLPSRPDEFVAQPPRGLELHFEGTAPIDSQKKK
jgi:hypothetical protein